MVPRCPSGHVTPAATLPVVPTTTGPEMIVIVWLVLLPAQVAVVVVVETEEAGPVVVAPTPKPTRRATAAITMTKTTATETQTILLLPGEVFDIEPLGEDALSTYYLVRLPRFCPPIHLGFCSTT